MADTAVAPAPVTTPAPTTPSLASLAQSLKLKDPTSWAADPAYENSVNSINSQLAGLNSSKGLQTQRVNSDYETNLGTLGDTNKQTLKDLSNRFASNNASFSGVNVGAQGEQGVRYQKAIGQLAQGKQRSLEDITRTITDQQATLQGQLGQAQIDRAERESTREKQQAADDAVAQTANTTANTQRQWLSELTATITKAVQPTATPTGSMTLPKTNPSAIIQQALAAVPPPAAKTPQQQAVEVGADPKLMQTLLQTLGYDPGPIDGVMGIKTQQALARWKQTQGLPATADLNGEIWQNLNLAAQAKMKPVAIGGPRMQITGPQAQVAQTPQQQLRHTWAANSGLGGQ